MAGRPALPDAEKKRRGTFDPRKSEAARAQKVVALFGDQIEHIKDPPAALHADAKREYWRWCEGLRAAGKLTHLWVERVLSYSIARHNVLTSIDKGKLPRSDDMRFIQAFQRDVGFIDADTPIAGQAAGDGRKFARIGFASRVRPPEAG